MKCMCCRWGWICCRRWKRRASMPRMSSRRSPIPAAAAAVTAPSRRGLPPAFAPPRRCSISHGSPMRWIRRRASYARAAAPARAGQGACSHLVRYRFGMIGRYRLWTMHTLKRQFRRVDGPLLDGMLAGFVILVITSLGLLYLWHSAREAQLDAVRTELKELARVAATLVDGYAHRLIKSQRQAGSPEHLRLLAPLVKFHKATSDIIYVYTAILDKDRIY